MAPQEVSPHICYVTRVSCPDSPPLQHRYQRPRIKRSALNHSTFGFSIQNYHHVFNQGHFKLADAAGVHCGFLPYTARNTYGVGIQGSGGSSASAKGKRTDLLDALCRDYRW